MFKQLILLLCLAPTTLWAQTVTPLPDSGGLLVNITEKTIQPLYRELDKAGEALAQQSKVFCSNPDQANFTAVRQAWAETLLAWQRTDALLFGPAVENQRDFNVHFTPPKKLVIQKHLNANTALTPDTIAQTGVGGRGLPALEWLLFDREQPIDAQLKTFQQDGGKRRCAYVQAASELLQGDLHEIAQAWADAGDSYAKAFKTAAQGNAHLANTQQALDTLVGKIYQSSEKIAKNRLGNPLGKGLISSGTNHDTVQNQSNAYQLEAWRSGYAIQSVRANMQGLQRLLVDGGILAQLKTQTANQALAEQLTTAIEAFLKLPVPETDPFELISQGKGAALDDYYQRAESIRSLIRTQLAPAMGVQLGFNDNDGD